MADRSAVGAVAEDRSAVEVAAEDRSAVEVAVEGPSAAEAAEADRSAAGAGLRVVHSATDGLWARLFGLVVACAADADAVRSKLLQLSSYSSS